MTTPILLSFFRILACGICAFSLCAGAFLLSACSSSNQPPASHLFYTVRENGDIAYGDSASMASSNTRIVQNPFDAIFSGPYDPARAAHVADSLHALYPDVPRSAFLRPAH